MTDQRTPGESPADAPLTGDPEATTVLPEGVFPGDAASLSRALAEATAAAEDARNQYLRTLAELENIRKRTAREVDSARRFGVERFAGDVLAVADSLELAGQSGATADARSLLEGQQATLRLLTKAFEKAGITELSPAGETFNPEQHEAMLAQPTVDQPPGTVLQVVQKGYALNGRVLRPARVIVARAPDA
jgi:molecular chaperone GrpE